jgi:hypothetical protein
MRQQNHIRSCIQSPTKELLQRAKQLVPQHEHKCTTNTRLLELVMVSTELVCFLFLPLKGATGRCQLISGHLGCSYFGWFTEFAPGCSPDYHCSLCAAQYIVLISQFTLCCRNSVLGNYKIRLQCIKKLQKYFSHAY